VVSGEVVQEKVGLRELKESWLIEDEDWERMGVQRRLVGGMPKPRLWTSAPEPIATVVAYPS